MRGAFTGKKPAQACQIACRTGATVMGVPHCAFGGHSAPVLEWDASECCQRYDTSRSVTAVPRADSAHTSAAAWQGLEGV